VPSLTMGDLVRKNWLLVIASTVVGILGGLVFTANQTPLYSSSTQVYVSVDLTVTQSANDLLQGGNAAEQRVRSYLDLVTKSTVLEPVAEDLGVSRQSLAEQVSASSPARSVLIDISATSPDPQQARDIAEAVRERFQDVVENEIERPSGSDASSVTLLVTEPAEVPTTPSSPSIRTNGVLGAFLGILLGVGLAAGRVVLDTRIHRAADVEASFAVPVVGSVPFVRDAVDHPLIVKHVQRGRAAEAFRTLRANLRFLDNGVPNRAFVVSSAQQSEGKSTTVTNLAVVLAETGARVALIDGDLRRPRVADIMGLEGAVGLTDVLIGRFELDDVLQPWGAHGLTVLPAGTVPPNPSELLGSAQMQLLVETLTSRFDYVLIDAPPVLPVADATLLGAITNGVLMVAAAKKSKRAELAAALRAFDIADVRCLGVVVTMTRSKSTTDGYGSGYYGESLPDDQPAATPAPRLLA
jgi:succinoglycan biosynthesis transport protein ExoP